VITLKQYLMGRDKDFAEELKASNVIEHAKVLLEQVNGLLDYLGIVAEVRSGWRPAAMNDLVGGSRKSYHITGRAIDLVDKSGGLKAVISAHSDQLRIFNLWMEHPSKTPSWCHLDNGRRPDRPVRIFMP